MYILPLVIAFCIVHHENLEDFIDDTVPKRVKGYHGSRSEVRRQQMELSNFEPLSPVTPRLQRQSNQPKPKDRAFCVHRAGEGIGRVVELS